MKKALCVKNLIVVALILSLFGCSSAEKTSDTAEGLYKIAEEYDQAERYDLAVKNYTEVKNKFPYSNWAIKAELAIADAHFKDESYGEAQISYLAFKDLHPKHPQTAYVTYRLGLSFFKQLPTTVDKDLSLSTDALKTFEEFLAKYPNDEHQKEVTNLKNTVLKMLADKEDYVGHFYFIREKYDSALTRYEGLLKQYPGQGLDEKAMARIAICAHKLGQTDKEKKYLSLLKEKFPNSKEYENARKALE